MILQQSYRDDIVDLIHQEPESTFSGLNTTKKAVLDDYALLNQMWPLFQKSVTEYEEEPWIAMSQALIDCARAHPI